VKLEKLVRLDRRIIFLAMTVCIILPLIFPFELPMTMQKTTRGLWEAIERADPAKQGVIVSCDYGPQTEAENQPMAVAVLRHCFARRLPVLLASLYVETTPLSNRALEQVVAEINARATTNADSLIYGRDYVNLGWVPPPIVPMLQMGTSISGVYRVDWDGRDTSTLPILQRIKNYSDVAIVVSISGGSLPLSFVSIVQPRFGIKVAAGCTAVMAPDFYPYFETGQFSGMLSGMKGAAEYEDAVAAKYDRSGARRAMAGMGAQSAAHLLIMVFVILGNIGYFLTRRKS
jgi:hypothetical protein